MTGDAPEARRLLAPLRERPLGVSDEDELAARRQRVVMRLRALVRDVPATRAQVRRHRIVASLALAATACLGVGGAWWLTRLPAAAPTAAAAAPAPNPALTTARAQGHVVHLLGGAERALLPGHDEPLSTAGELLTAAGSTAEIATGAGLRLHLAEGTRLSLAGLADDQAARFVRVSQGELVCHVPRFVGGGEFSVVTPDTRAVVHGTVFSVRVNTELPNGSQTCVLVSEGLVEIFHAQGRQMLAAGQRWGCAEPSGDDAAFGVDRSGKASGAASAAAHRVPQRGPAAPRGTLAEENRLLQEALAAERQGDVRLARSRLQALLTRYPESPLAPDARAALARSSGR